jgi:GDP-L-fucose synthase
MDNSRLSAMGWQPKTSLRQGIARAYAAFLAGEGRNI